jgi:hypothetical protein
MPSSVVVARLIVGSTLLLLLSDRLVVGTKAQQKDDGHEEDGEHGDQLLVNRAVGVLLLALVTVVICDHGGSSIHRLLQVQSQLN